MLSARHGTTANILRHWMGAYVGCLSRRHLATLFPVEHIDIRIPCWMPNQVKPYAPAAVARLEYDGGENAVIVWGDGVRSLLSVAADGLVYGRKPEVEMQGAMIFGPPNGFCFEVSARTADRAPSGTRWTVERMVSHVENGWEALTARAMAKLRIRKRRRKPSWSWIDPDPRAWERNTTWRRKLSAKGIATIGGDDDRDDKPRKPRVTEWGKQVLAKAAAATRRATRSVRMPAMPAPAGAAG